MDYCVNKNTQDNGDHEVHEMTCPELPDEANQLALGTFSNCEDAVEAAKRIYPQSNGCKICSKPCHTT